MNALAVVRYEDEYSNEIKCNMPYRSEPESKKQYGGEEIIIRRYNPDTMEREDYRLFRTGSVTAEVEGIVWVKLKHVYDHWVVRGSLWDNGLNEIEDPKLSWWKKLLSCLDNL